MRELAVDDVRWQTFVSSHPDATSFHHPRWALLLAEVYGFRPFVLALADPDGAVLAGVPVLEVAGPLGRSRRWVSLPFTDACPPLVTPALEEQLASGLDAMRVEAGIARLEIRGALAGVPLEPRGGATAHRLALSPDPDEVVRGFSKNVIRDIRVAERAGIVVRSGESERDLVDAFYGLHLQTRRRLGVPIQPRRFFRLLWRRVIEPGHGSVLVALSGSTPVAATVLLHERARVEYKYSASDESFAHLQAPKLILAEAIRRSCLAGQTSFDFGRTDGKTEGLRQFKRRFGPVERPLEYSALGLASKATSESTLSTVMRRILTRSPTWVTRVVGEALYRYAA